MIGRQITRRTIDRHVLGRTIDSVNLGANVNQIDELIMSLSPVFYIKDALTVVDGKFVDESGNNKVLTASTVLMTNDTITLPASDAAIIAALTAAGMYGFFYTNDTTPKTIAISAIRTDYSRYWYVSENNRIIVLFANPLSNVDKATFDTARKLTQGIDRFSKNLVYDSNFYLKSGSNIIDNIGTIPVPMTGSYGVAKTPITSDNTFDFSHTKKTITVSIVHAAAGAGIFSLNTDKCCGKITWGFWIDKTTVLYQLQITGTLASALWTTAQLTLNRTTGSSDGIVTIDAVSGNWVHITIHDRINQNVSVNKLLSDSGWGVNSYGSSLIGQSYDVRVCDVVLINDNITFNINTDYGTAFPTTFNNKKLCTVSDSIGLGIWGKLITQYCGFSTLYNAAKSGGRMNNLGGNTLWLPYYKETIAATAADLFIISTAGNDQGVEIGVIGGEDYSRFLDSYSYLIDYIQAENPTADIMLCTFAGNTGGITAYEPTPTKAEFNTDFYLNPGIRELGTHYNLKVCDLFALRAFDYETVRFFFVDAAHWAYSNDMAMANIMAQFIKDNF